MPKKKSSPVDLVATSTEVAESFRQPRRRRTVDEVIADAESQLAKAITERLPIARAERDAAAQSIERLDAEIPRLEQKLATLQPTPLEEKGE